MRVPVSTAAPSRATWFGHPRGLTILFLTEMWSEFSYYGMRAILVYYMVGQLRLDQQRASMIFGLYTSYACAASCCSSVWPPWP